MTEVGFEKASTMHALGDAFEREEVVRIALEWERTPYVHEGRIKGKCADCTFIGKVYEEAGLVAEIAIPKYGAQAYLNRQACAYRWVVEKFAKHQIDEAQARPGDVVLFNLARTFSHGAIIIEPGRPHIIHADLGAKHVIRARYDTGALSACERIFYSMW